MKYYLGIDNGGTVTKAALYDAKGVEIAVASVKANVSSIAPGFVERDMDEMREANYAVIRSLLAKAGVDKDEVAAIACCGHGKGLYLVAADGRPVRAGILSSDTRALEYSEAWEKNGVAARVFRKTYQRVLPCQPVSLLAWLRDNEPESLVSAKWIFECKDFVRYCLTGEAFAEITDYSGANLVNLDTGAYDPELLEMFGLDGLIGKLPPLRSSTELCGRVTEEAASRTGLRAGTPVAGGMFDIDACALAVNAISEDVMCMIAGTWSINEYVGREPVRDGSVMMNSLFCLPGYYLIEESSPTSAVNFEWFIKTFLPEVEAEARAAGSSVYDTVNAWVRGIPCAEDCPTFFPFIMASNANPRAKASLVGMTYNHGRGHVAKAIYEGVAYSHRYHFDRLMKSRRTPFSAIRLAGGVANSREWAQIFADVMDRKIEIVDIAETGTLGCAICASVAIGDYKSLGEASSNMVRVREAVSPLRGHVEIYRRRYARYLRLLEALDPAWDEREVRPEG